MSLPLVIGTIRCAFTHYPSGKPEVTVWHDLPAVPRVGDTVHLDRAREVTHVSWANDTEYGGWHAEIAVR